MIIPYIYIDGIPTMRDSDIASLFKTICKENVLKKVFYDGSIQNESQFISLVKNPNVIFLCVVDDNYIPLCIVWLNTIDQRTAQFHFCCFKRGYGKSGPLAREAIDYIFSLGSFDVLYGFVPKTNKLANAAVTRFGLELKTILYDFCYDVYNESRTPANLYALRRIEYESLQ